MRRWLISWSILIVTNRRLTRCWILLSARRYGISSLVVTMRCMGRNTKEGAGSDGEAGDPR